MTLQPRTLKGAHHLSTYLRLCHWYVMIHQAYIVHRSFYALSKTHHPDVNPTDPHAARTFSLISESYTILSDPSRRATYDRDVLRLHHASSHVHHPAHGSYSSTNPAGGRAPSGLSRRRGTFRGPPPSFYRSGGWGTQSDKRRKAHEESTGTGAGATGQAEQHTAHQHGGHAQHTGPWAEAASRGQYGGMGPGSNPFASHRADDHVPHFDKAGHTRTHQREDRRRSHRRRAMGDDDVEFEPQTSLAGHFFIVAGILGVTMLAPLVYLQFMRLGRTDRDKG